MFREGGVMSNILLSILCVFIGGGMGFIARYFNASLLVQSLCISISIAIVMFVFFQIKGGIK